MVDVISESSARTRNNERLNGPFRLALPTFFLVLVVFSIKYATPAPSGDESVTILAVRRSWGQLWLMRQHDPALLPYYLFVKAWSVIVPSDSTLRYPSVIATAAAAAVLVSLAAKFLSHREALAVGLTFIALPSVTRYALDARPYALATLFAALTLWAAVAAKARPTVSRLAVTAIFLELSIVFHAYTGTLVLVLLLLGAVLWRRGDRRLLIHAVLVSGVVVLVSAPLLLQLYQHATGQISAPSVSMQSVAYAVGALPLGVLKPPFAVVCALGALLLAAIGAWVGWRADRHHSRELVALSVAWLVVPPVALTVLQSITGTPTLLTRYWQFCVPALAALCWLGAGALLRRSRILGAVLSLAVLATSVPTAVALRSIDGHNGERWVTLPRVLEAQPIAAMPMVLSGFALNSLLVYDRGQYSKRLFFAEDAPANGLVYPRLQSVGSAATVAAARAAGGLIVYQSRTKSSAVIGRSDLRRFVNNGDRRYALRVACNYFGDALGVYEVTESTSPPLDASKVMESIESAAHEQATCRVLT